MIVVSWVATESTEILDPTEMTILSRVILQHEKINVGFDFLARDLGFL